MQHIDIRKKRPSRWPWLAGVLVLALIAWGVGTLLAPDEPADEVVATPVAEDALAPSGIPAPPRAPEEAVSGRPLTEIAPLDEGDVGARVHLEGEVVATGNDVFWILAGAEVIRVDSDRLIRKGDTLLVGGVVATADPEKTDRMRSVLERHPASGRWNVNRSLKVVEARLDSAPPADTGIGGR